MSDTPRTDEILSRRSLNLGQLGEKMDALEDHARRLERENAMLLEALEDMTRVFSDLPASRNYGELVRKARAAIAKVKEGK